MFSSATASWQWQQGGTVNNHRTSMWMGDLMSAQLRVSLHHVATWSWSSIHHSPFPRCLLCHQKKDLQRGGQETCASFHVWNTSRKPSRGVIVANVLQSKQFSYVNLIHSNTMQYVLTLLEHASPRVPFVLLWCIHSALWNTARMKLYTEPSQAEVTPPIIHPSCWQPSGRIILERLGRMPRYENGDFWYQAILWTGECH